MKTSKSTELIEQPLYETIELVHEDDALEDPYKLLTIRGVASKAGFVNANRRMYPLSVLTKAVEAAQKDVEQGTLLGELDHPPDKGSLSRATVKYTGLWMEGDELHFEGEVLPTEDGRQLELLLRSGVGVGMSTRGYGMLRPVTVGDDTVDEVQDYELKGIDCVLDGSNEFSKVASFESLEGGTGMDLKTLETEHSELLKQIQEEAAADAVAAAKDDLHKEFELKVEEALEEKKSGFIAEAKAEVMESDEVVQLKSIVEGVIEVVKPMLPEAKSIEELDADLRQKNEDLEAQLESVQSEVSVLKEEKDRLAKSIEEEKTKKEVAEKIEEMVEGHRYAKQLTERLAGCESPEKVEEAFAAEVAYIEALVETSNVPAGDGETLEEDNTGEVDEKVVRQRRLAGIREGGS